MATVSADQYNQLPHDLEAERNLLASALIDPDVMLRVGDLEPGDFWQAGHQQIYAVMCDLHRRHEAIDIITVGNALRERAQIEDIGGDLVLTDLLIKGSEAGYTSAASTYSAIIQRCAQRRALIRASGDIARAAQAFGDGLIDGLYDTVSQLLADAMDRSDAETHLRSVSETWVDYWVNQQARRERLEADPNVLIQTGLVDLDRILDDLPPAYLHIVGARSSVGKTIYMEQIAETNARRGHQVVYYHLELTHQSMMDRRVARYSGVPVGSLRRGATGTDANAQAVADALEQFGAWDGHVEYVHCPGWTADRIVADMTRMHAKDECELAIVDYIGKLDLDHGRRGRNDAALIGDAVETLKIAAERLEIPVIAGSQVSRAWKQTGDKRPTIADLRGSGEIEEKANQVVMLHRVNQRDEGEILPVGTSELMEAYVEKNTTGAVGKVRLWHVVGRYLFRSASREDYE